MRVSVVIPNWNGLRHLPTCLAALQEQTFEDFETIVVDNASTDDSVAYIRANWPRVRVVSLTENAGFAGAINAGIERSASPYVVLLNNDTRADPAWLSGLVSAMDTNPSFAFGSSKLLRFDQPDRVDSAGHAYSLWRSSGENIGEGEPSARFTQPAWIFGACAAASIYRRSLFDDIGRFDDDFFFLHEDVEFDVRANVAGHRCLFVPNAIVYHKRGGSFDLGPEIDLMGVRNRIWVAGKTLPAGALIAWLVASLARALWMIPLRLVGLARNQPGAQRTSAPWAGVRAPQLAQAVWEAVRSLPAKRRDTAAVRRLSSIALIRRMVATRRPQPLA